MRSDITPPTPTEVIASWIPHDARWHEQARAAALTGEEALRRYVTGLVVHHTDGSQPLDEYDLRSIGAVVEDLRGVPLAAVDWRRVRDALLLPVRVREGL